MNKAVINGRQNFIIKKSSASKNIVDIFIMY